MANEALTKTTSKTTLLFDDFFKPWNEWFDNGGNLWGRTLSVPSVNITEDQNEFQVSLAVPGMKKEDFKIDVNNNILTISSEKEDEKEEKEKRYTRREYSYTSFSRSFTLPDEVNKEKIEARYENGILKLSLPRKEEVKKNASKQISVK